MFFYVALNPTQPYPRSASDASSSSLFKTGPIKENLTLDVRHKFPKLLCTPDVMNPSSNQAGYVCVWLAGVKNDTTQICG